MQYYLELLRQYCIEFLPVEFFSKSIQTFAQEFFLWKVIWSLLGNIALGFQLCNIVPRVLRQHCNWFFYAMLAGAFWTTLHRVMTCASCSKSIKTMLYRIFPYAMLFGAF